MKSKGDFDKLNIAHEVRELLKEEFKSVFALAMTSPTEVMKRCEVSGNSAARIVELSRKQLGMSKPQTADELFDDHINRPRLTTSSQNLDAILGGGIPTGSITEFSGAFSTGKTQLGFQLCINVQLDVDEGGLEGKALFVDTENTFSPARIAEMSYTFVDDPKEMLKNIYVSRAYDAAHQVQIIEQANRVIEKNNIRMLIVDSMASHFRAEFPGKENLPRRQQILMAHAEKLQRLAETYDLAIMTTNQILSNPDAILSGSASIEPALGFAWGHRPTHRILLRKARGTARIARIFDSPELAEREAVFHITAQGIRDSGNLDF